MDVVDSGVAVAPPPEAVEGNEVGGSNSGEEDKGLMLFEDGEKNFGGNRWPRQETLALLKIRSDMDAIFRDATLKAPLWDEISRKLGELGFNRTPKKCKEKFENVYKYHKRTKIGRCGKSDNSKKVYKFSDELEAFDIHHHNHISVQSHHRHSIPPPKLIAASTVSSAINTTINNSLPLNFQNISSANRLFMSSTSSSTASEEDKDTFRKTKKRKWRDFFVNLTKEVIEKQERLQLKFLESLERIENQRKLRDEAWRMKEMTRVNQEHQVLVQETSITAAKDAAVIAFLQNISPSTPPVPHNAIAKVSTGRGSESRWPKAEVEALIRLRMEMEMKYEENGQKGLLWEEISGGMRGIGYNRSSKRCKEKWENINKYFKKVKDGKKKRGEESKTCPYFHLLDALYKEKEKEKQASFDMNAQMEALMVEPEQQWPPPFQANHQVLHTTKGEGKEEEKDSGSSSTDVED
ncbi:trihelix transcription factor GT-2-like [Cucurbita pepo subsp. pepo]|uniref:trihelix transcription factor GT-2-like n=1 Tax=Cucurbita pepo subsp. pepo TaxID=3664 RepID=UPI000C9D6EA4|nr:trihelix transcription factor GT-2-like [Cucurbita pepo subsp. pepo]